MTKIRLIALDVDGTLVKKGGFAPTRAVRDALKQAQKQGMLVALASGRARHALDPTVLKGVKLDYFICANGAQVLDAAGRQLAAHTMEPEEMYALVDWCEDYDYPVGFSFSDGYYAYTEYAALREFYGRGTGHPEQMLDGEDQVRHLESMPFAAFCNLPPEGMAGFEAKYGYLGLRFVPYAPDHYDVMSRDMDKAWGLAALAEKLGLAREEIAAVGDGLNDLELLEYAGIGAAMGNGVPELKQAADRVLPSVEEDGLAQFVQELLA